MRPSFLENTHTHTQILTFDPSQSSQRKLGGRLLVHTDTRRASIPPDGALQYGKKK